MYYKVSVILPTYNRSDTIMRAINSVLNQTVSFPESCRL
jgi:glycosyltransferase involved in cell wall biosynthesis